jgi:hypothetical protein
MPSRTRKGPAPTPLFDGGVTSGVEVAAYEGSADYGDTFLQAPERPETVYIPPPAKMPILSELGSNDEPVGTFVEPALVDAVELLEAHRREADTPWLGGDAGRSLDDPQSALFEKTPRWTEHWKGMPAYEQKDLAPLQSVVVHFRNDADRGEFATLVGQAVLTSTKSIWFPKAEIARMVDKRFIAPQSSRPPLAPIYIVSKGRWETRLTSRSLHAMNLPHYIVVEEHELEQYSAVVDSTAILLVLDPRYKAEYDPCDDLGDTKSKGPGAARNFAWEHAIAAGAAWHWVMDDNIDGFYRLSQNLKTPAHTGAIFRCMEDFAARYENVGMAGPNYFMFAKRKTTIPPFVLNTRIYSCNLIRNDLPYRWRGRYNEDTDLSLRMLKDGLCTVQFNAFLQMKVTTQTLSGGCTTEFYEHEGTRPKSEMQVKLHPDVSELVWKWGRWHHRVDYGRFKDNALRFKQGVRLPDSADEYGMVLERDAISSRKASRSQDAD